MPPARQEKATRTVLEEAVIRCLGDVTLAEPPDRIIRHVYKPDGWNDHEASAIGRYIVLNLNGRVTVDCTEQYEAIEQKGLIALQVHSPQALEARFRNIRVQEG